MSNTLGATVHLAGQVAKVGMFAAVHELGARWAKSRAGEAGASRPGSSDAKQSDLPEQTSQRNYPNRGDILQALRDLIARDAALVSDGICQPLTDFDRSPLDIAARLREMFADIPKSAERSASEDRQEVRTEVETDGLPEYYTQNFHYQTGGYLTSESARIYDMQVETLFSGTAAAMRRQALRPIADALAGKDQRRMRLLDVACGTGRLLGEVARAFPALPLAGVDLSAAYITEARTHLGDRRHATLETGNAEALPYLDASFDIATCCFLFHELPAPVRRTALAEMARVLKPGGTLVFIDSMQHGDAPAFDGMLDAFPDRFHEPYYRQYLDDDLDAAMHDVGLVRDGAWNAFLSKVMVRRRTADRSPTR
ncbi:MAG: class I SAM-dependent methyltransferase [Pseudomonadota bacterium]